jgi:hypothetical protein
MLPETASLPINTWLSHDRSEEAPIPADLPVIVRCTAGKLHARYSDMVQWQHVAEYLIEETPESAAADLAAKFGVATADVSAAYDEMLAAASDLTSDRYALAKARLAALCSAPADRMAA